ncbi:MAG TPA: hypothetical protein VM008_04410 [Phycisphaerae bacterium]|nr:hypothetical protein [Phycisphaerae bacterium]
MTRAIGKLTLLAAVTLGAAACESEFAPDRTKPVATRAVQNPANHNDALGEEMAGTAEGVPLVTVDFPNREGQTPRVRTIADNVRDTLNPPATTGPANVRTPGAPTTQPMGVELNPLTGESQ